MKKIIVSIIVILLLVSVACTTYATEGNLMEELLNELRQQESGNISENENVEQIPEGTNTNTSLNTNTNNNVNENLPTTTPHAGLGDYSGLVFVALFAVLAVYAYKKVREYNA